jgi:uncharacterized protein (DUF2252 family)
MSTSSKEKSSTSTAGAGQSARRTPDERRGAGKRLREAVPREAHGTWRASADRAAPLSILRAADATRQAKLVPLRYGRMLQSPFTFYRGSAGAMAADLARTPSTKVYVQACGDAHLLNFGGFATPERRLLFDVNDLDETLPAPWEWDVKRLVASFVLAARSNSLTDAEGRDAAIACARSYRQTMRDFSNQDVLQTWYARLDEKDYLAMLPQDRKAMLAKHIAKATRRSRAELVYPKLVEDEDGQPHIHDTPPTVFHQVDSMPATTWT